METVKKSDQTRELLLRAAFEEIHRNGFQAASLSKILADTSLTKGALYHHFPNKTALGYAVVDELVANEISQRWLAPLENQDDPITALRTLLQEAGKSLRPADIILGCPLNNLAQEMSPVDEGFRKRINHIYNVWRGGIAQALMRGQANGTVRTDVKPGETAAFLVAAMEGCMGMAKNAHDPELLFNCGKSLIGYLESLRVTHSRRGSM
jgi:TetR/AcrR family transcriptional repressor of nem operon